MRADGCRRPRDPYVPAASVQLPSQLLASRSPTPYPSSSTITIHHTTPKTASQHVPKSQLQTTSSFLADWRQKSSPQSQSNFNLALLDHRGLETNDLCLSTRLPSRLWGADGCRSSPFLPSLLLPSSYSQPLPFSFHPDQSCQPILAAATPAECWQL